MSQIDNAIDNVVEAINDSITTNLRTLGDLIREELAKSNTEETAGFEVTINTGESFVVVSDSDPRLQREVAPEETSIRKVQTATAGGQ